MCGLRRHDGSLNERQTMTQPQSTMCTMHAKVRMASSPISRGFTLIELLVAIGAMALIAVGIAAVFGSVGKTVAGGRRISVLNEYAALVERQMRSDFESMTRDGVLLIRQSYADWDGTGTFPDDLPRIGVSFDDPNPRPRRVDEILFFRHGQFSSARLPAVPGMNAQATEAMIYYGHGIKLHPLNDLSTGGLGGNTPRYDRPQINDGALSGSTKRPFRSQLGLGDSSDPENPNRYAGDWTLLRKVTLLAQPSSSTQQLPDAALLADLGLQSDDVLDNELQIGGQPAASSAFRHLAAILPSDQNPYLYPQDSVRRAGGDVIRYPSLASGIVDVATTDLAEIRRIIMDVRALPWNIPDESVLEAQLDDQYNAAGGPGGGDLTSMHRWMEDLFPIPGYPNIYDPQERDSKERVHYEPTMPDYVGMMKNFEASGTTGIGRVREAFRLADQQQISSDVFIPNCTEFIVEYSFGQVDEDPNSPMYGQLIWFGLNRTLDIDNNTASNGNEVQVVAPYPFYSYVDASGNNAVVPRPYAEPYFKANDPPDNPSGSVNLSQRLLYTGSVNNGVLPYPLVAHFGYTDPLYQPSSSEDPPSVLWPWPKLIRVTMTLADPRDPTIEKTFQFVFQTPEGKVY